MITSPGSPDPGSLEALERARADAYQGEKLALDEKIMACASGKIDQGIEYFTAQKQCRDDIAPGKELLSECVEKEMAKGMGQVPAIEKCAPGIP